jgi:iron complex transport system ATP-binding protein
MGILELKDITFRYEDSAFINNLSLSVEDGEFIGLIGPNGSGKTTLLKLLAGLIKPAWGEVLLWGKSLSSYKGKDRAKLISYLPQMIDVNIPVMVREIVKMGLSPYDILPAISIEAAMDMVGIQDKADLIFSRLSGGEKRRAFIAMTLVQCSGLLLLDEPLANLDIKYQLELMSLLRDLNFNKKIGVIMAVHDISMAFYFDRILIVKEGQIVADGRPSEVLTESSIRQAFGVDIKILGGESGKPGIIYP